MSEMMSLDELLSELTDSLKPQGELRPICLQAAEAITRLRSAMEDLASYEMVVVGFSGVLKPSDVKDCHWVAGFSGRQPEFRHFEAARAALSAAKGET